MRSLRETITQRQRCVIPQKCDTTQQHGFHSARMEAMYGARIASAHANSTARGLHFAELPHLHVPSYPA